MATGPNQMPSVNNTYVRSLSTRLVTQFSRNPKDFALNRYIQIKDVSKGAGYYLKLDPSNAARIRGGASGMNEFVWPDGQPRPRRNNGTSEFKFADYTTERFDYDFSLGNKSKEQAEWDVSQVNIDDLAQKAMTGRTLRVQEVLANNANYLASHIQNVTALSGASAPGTAGNWEQSTTTRMDIKKSLNHGVGLIKRASYGKVGQKKDMILVMNPNTASRVGESQEMVNALIQSPDGLKHFSDSEHFDNWGIPEKLYGVSVVVEDTVYENAARGQALDQQYAMPDGAVYLLSRPGQLEAKAGMGQSYSSMMLFIYNDDLTVETLDDRDNRRTEGHVVDDTAEVMTAPITAVKFTNVV